MTVKINSFANTIDYTDFPITINEVEMPNNLGVENRRIALALGRSIGMDVFSHEYGILIFLHGVGRASHKEVLFSACCSTATAQRKLDLLTGKALVETAIDTADKRRRIFGLAPRTHAILDEELRFFYGWDKKRNDCKSSMEMLVENLEARLGVQVFSPEYKITIILYNRTGSNTLEIFEKSGLSQGNFYNVLRAMKCAGTIISLRDECDKREMRYYLSEKVRDAIDSAHLQLSLWYKDGNSCSP